MARITIEIDTLNESFQGVLASLLNVEVPSQGFDYAEEMQRVEEEASQPNVAATQDAEPGERQRRTRRTKAQIDASGPVTQGSVTVAPTASQGPTDSTPPESSPQSNGGSPDASDPFAEKASPPASSGSLSPTLEDLRDAMKRYLAVEGNNASKMNPILKSFPRADGNPEPLQTVTQMDPGSYAAAIAALGV